jgi:hypothetical protein
MHGLQSENNQKGFNKTASAFNRFTSAPFSPLQIPIAQARGGKNKSHYLQNICLH